MFVAGDCLYKTCTKAFQYPSQPLRMKWSFIIPKYEAAYPILLCLWSVMWLFKLTRFELKARLGGKPKTADLKSTTYLSDPTSRFLCLVHIKHVCIDDLIDVKAIELGFLWNYNLCFWVQLLYDRSYSIDLILH